MADNEQGTTMTPDEVLKRAEQVRQLNAAERKVAKLTAKIDAGHVHLVKPRHKAASKLAALRGGAT